MLFIYFTLILSPLGLSFQGILIPRSESGFIVDLVYDVVSNNEVSKSGVWALQLVLKPPIIFLKKLSYDSNLLQMVIDLSNPKYLYAVMLYSTIGLPSKTHKCSLLQILRKKTDLVFVKKEKIELVTV